MALTTNGLKVIFGGAALATDYEVTSEKAEEILEALKQEGISHIDTSQVYTWPTVLERLTTTRESLKLVAARVLSADSFFDKLLSYNCTGSDSAILEQPEQDIVVVSVVSV
ncbi:hypothetical protein Plec18167_004983 [Paecilomyces lecythidis]|uniref:NADP-dependent oxidoreductase domain-containing protein n=1 Tax=Paecilomyces lecythidis TaxID=3004212 RepID=A0ABR3XNW9_9EURO